MRIKIAPSILSADFSCLKKEITRVERAGADMLHIDVMDGHFVPNLTIGPAVVKCIRKVTRLPLDVHLMIEKPEKFIAPFVAAGSDMITVHIETISKSKIKSLKSKLSRTKKKSSGIPMESGSAKGVRLGISLNPNTPLAKIKPVLKYVDFVLVMSVYPGFSGQEFIPAVIPKIKKLRSIFKGEISVDGGVNDRIAPLLRHAGANILAAGSYIFGAKDMKLAIERIRDAGKF